MFRRKEDDVAQDLLGGSEQEGSATQMTSAESMPASATTPAAAMTSAAAPAPAPTAAPSYARPMEATRPSAPVYRPASAATGTTEPARGRTPEYRPTGSSLPSSLTTAVAAGFEKGQAKAANRRVLTVGNDILLKGEIATCDRLVIEGAVDATLNEVHTVEIAEGGSFKGFAEIEDAEISGTFEGELVVRNRLVIYATGQVRGKITYGEIEIERGGEMTGEIKTMSQAKGKGTAPAAKAKLEAAA